MVLTGRRDLCGDESLLVNRMLNICTSSADMNGGYFYGVIMANWVHYYRYLVLLVQRYLYVKREAKLVRRGQEKGGGGGVVEQG